MCNPQVAFPLQYILFLALTDREMFCFWEASHWWLPLLETELQREKEAFHGNDGKGGFQQGDWNRIAHQQTSPAHHAWLVCWKEQPCGCQPPSLGSSCLLFNGLKRKWGFPGWDRITGATWRRVELDVEQTERLLLARQMQEEIQQLAWFVRNIRGNEIIDSMGRRNPTKHEGMGCAVL